MTAVLLVIAKKVQGAREISKENVVSTAGSRTYSAARYQYFLCHFATMSDASG